MCSRLRKHWHHDHFCLGLGLTHVGLRRRALGGVPAHMSHNVTLCSRHAVMARSLTLALLHPLCWQNTHTHTHTLAHSKSYTRCFAVPPGWPRSRAWEARARPLCLSTSTRSLRLRMSRCAPSNLRPRSTGARPGRAAEPSAIRAGAEAACCHRRCGQTAETHN